MCPAMNLWTRLLRLPPDSKDLVGKRVVGEINLACGHCSWCARRLGRHCPGRSVLGIVRHPGAFREFLTLPERNLFVVPDSIPTEVAVFTEPLAAACEILDQVQIPCGTPIAVLGDGKLGLLVAQVLQANGYRVHQFGRHPEKLKIAARAGVTTEIRGEHLPEAEYQWVVDATGSQAGLHAAIRMVEPRGTIILKSTVHGEIPLDTAPVIVNEITLACRACVAGVRARPRVASTRRRSTWSSLDLGPHAAWPKRSGGIRAGRATWRDEGAAVRIELLSLPSAQRLAPRSMALSKPLRGLPRGIVNT